MRNRNGFTLAELIVVTAIMVALFIFMVDGPCHLERNDYFVKVTDKGIKPAGNTSKYLFFTQLQPSGEIRVFENSDSFIEGKWDSSDIYAQIQVGKSYRFKTYGWRWQFFSWYENIIGFEELKPEK